MANEYDDFFLGTNVNEPVAIEIPVRADNLTELQKFLENVGFAVTMTGSEKDKILINNYKTHGWASVITPAVKPSDRKKLYESLKYALDKYAELSRDTRKESVEIGYPHILDLKHLVAANTNVGKKNAEINRILFDLQDSKDVITLDQSDRDYIKKRNQIFPYGLIFNGSTIPDPYSVVTGDNHRFIRYGSTDAGYAFTFTGVGGAKQINGYQNITTNDRFEKMFTVGFFFQYKPMDSGQLYFHNTGIETKNAPVNSDTDTNETPINSFDNPCVGIYIVWSSVRHPNITYVHKIDENDPRYQMLKEYYAPCNPALPRGKRARFQTWTDEHGHNETYMPVQNNDLDAVYTKADGIIDANNKQKQKIAEIKEKIVNIKRELYDLKETQSAPVFSDITSFQQYINLEKIIKDKSQYAYEYKNKLKEISKQIQDVQQEILSSGFAQMDEFKDISTLDSSVRNKKIYVNNLEKNLMLSARDSRKYLDDFISKFVVNWMFLSDEEYAQIPFDVRKQIFIRYQEKIPGLSNGDLAKKIIGLYISAKPDEKTQLFDILSDIGKRAQKPMREGLKKYTESEVSNPEEKKILLELFRKDNIFVKHTERAKKMMILKNGTNLLKSQMNSVNLNNIETTRNG